MPSIQNIGNHFYFRTTPLVEGVVLFTGICVCVCRLQFEKQFSDQIVELKREREEETRKLNQQWQHRVEELQTQVTHNASFLRRSDTSCTRYFFPSLCVVGGEESTL